MSYQQSFTDHFCNKASAFNRTSEPEINDGGVVKTLQMHLMSTIIRPPQKLCHVEIRRLLLIMGIVVAVVVVFQLFALPFGTILSLPPASEDSVFMVGNVTLSSKSKPVISYIVPLAANNTNASDLEDEAEYEDEAKRIDTGFDSASYDDRDLDSSFVIYQDGNLHSETTFKKDVTYEKSMTIQNATSKSNNSTQQRGREFRYSSLEQVENSNINSKLHNDLKADNKKDGFASLPLVSPGISTKGVGNLNADLRISVLLANKSSMSNVKQATAKTSDLSQTVSVTLSNNVIMATNHRKRRRVMQPTSISQMNSLLVRSVAFSSSKRPRQLSARDRELLSAKFQIENAPILRNTPGLHASLFRNASMFIRSYELMERILKVYIYREGEKPIFHQPQLNGIYASEGWFMRLIEGNKQLVVRDPRKAHLFYLPFSLKRLRIAFDEQNSRGWKDLMIYLNNYVDMISEKYRFWNRTGGADHFLVACHDWALQVTKERMRNCIRVLCNANVGKGFKIGKDTTLPVTYVRKVEDPLRDLGGNPPSERPILAFFAGGMHGYLRPILLQHWENKEPDMKIFGPMPRDTQGKEHYREHMKSSKYCICARGYEVHTPRVVEAIFYECVPVIVSDNYVPPFFEVLDWETFAVFVQEKDIPNLRNILLSIPEEKYLAMQLGVKMVQQHFLWHKKPEKYDLFHMILHSVWYRRIFQMKAR
ncbi:hypothetical protein L1049_001122 [Liquidambar formosana]|uniref:Exostosin GT47 domain-containing protein n=1 Tax=Liquidambar formosana TaxID=63359 RepID=A0AAP0NBS0_LIQFO